MPTVLVTGSSRGIGHATALRLAAAGWDVYAGVRRDEDGAALQAAAPDRIHPIRLDVTSSDDIAALAENLPATLDAVVNNAGIAVMGPIEGLPIADVRWQLDVNVVGAVAVTQAVLPRLRESRGRIVFVSSLSGRIATPLTGAYNASKFALEGLADALRMELAPWGIRVALIEPAQTDTDIWRDAEKTLEESLAKMTPAQLDLYAGHIAGTRKMIPMSQRLAAPVDGVTGAIESALTSRRPHSRYVVGLPAKVQARLTALTPTPVLDQVLRLATGVPRKL